MTYTSRMNSLNLKTSQTPAASKAPVVMNLGNLGAKVNKLAPSNNPGPMTSPSAQGPVRPGTAASKTASVNPKP